jgi:hypothetical protein
MAYMKKNLALPIRDGSFVAAGQISAMALKS